MILDSFQVRWGWGRHVGCLLATSQSAAHFIEASKLSYMNLICTILGLLFIKSSIALLLLRIFGTKKVWRWVIYSILGFVFVTTVISVTMVLAQCRPLDKLWNPTRPGTCWSPQVVIHIGYYNGGKLPAMIWSSTKDFADLQPSHRRSLRLGTFYSSHCRHVEPPNECTKENWYCYTDGHRIFVSFGHFNHLEPQ